MLRANDNVVASSSTVARHDDQFAQQKYANNNNNNNNIGKDRLLINIKTCRPSETTVPKTSQLIYYYITVFTVRFRRLSRIFGIGTFRSTNRVYQLTARTELERILTVFEGRKPATVI